MYTDDDWLGPEMAWTGMHDVELDEQSFEAFVDEDGMPTEARLEYTLVGDGESGADRLTFLYVWLFTHVGEEVTIEAPEQGQPI